MSCCIIAQKKKVPHLFVWWNTRIHLLLSTFQRTVVLSCTLYVFVVCLSYTRRLMSTEATSGCSCKPPQTLFGRCLLFLKNFFGLPISIFPMTLCSSWLCVMHASQQHKVVSATLVWWQKQQLSSKSLCSHFQWAGGKREKELLRKARAEL